MQNGRLTTAEIVGIKENSNNNDMHDENNNNDNGNDNSNNVKTNDRN